jgi:hypothetical protein
MSCGRPWLAPAVNAFNARSGRDANIRFKGSTSRLREDDTMSESPQDSGVIHVLLEELNAHRLPRALALKAKVDRGETLDEYDMHELEEVVATVKNVQPLIGRHPEYHDLVGRILSLYNEITAKALAHEHQR